MPGSEFDGGTVTARADRLHGAEITFDFPSVGATENIVTAAVLADGWTVIHNAAREPEIIDLCEFLNEMGARVDGAGTSTLRIEGVEPGTLHGCEHETVPDRIQAATYIAACAVTGGRLDLLNAQSKHMAMVLSRFGDMGMEIESLPYGLRVAAPASAPIGRCGDAAVPRDRHRLQATHHHDALRRRRGRGRDREPLPGAFRLRRGVAAPRCRHQDRRPPCPDQGSRSSRRVPRSWLTTSAPGRRWSSPASPPRAPRRSPASTTSIAATTTSSADSVTWVPRSNESAANRPADRDRPPTPAVRRPGSRHRRPGSRHRPAA